MEEKEISSYLSRKYNCDVWRYADFKDREFNFKIRCCECGLRHDVVLKAVDSSLFMGFKRLGR